ncbi:hypothetical protein TNCV_1354271 [Trichonephila clavipes]|nr:hypothetical protein TNCV_1354271 [Trichonephila clavipes]
MLPQVYAFTVLAEEEGRDSLSAIKNQMFSMGGRSTDRHARVAIEYPMCPGKSKHDIPHVILHYLVGRGCLAGLYYKTQPLDVSQECTDLRSNYHQSKLETWCRLPNDCPNPDACKGPLCQYRRQAGDERSPLYMYTSIRILDAEPSEKSDSVPFLYPALSFDAPEYRSLSLSLSLCYAVKGS